MISTTASGETPQRAARNRLAGELSPYLLQHADNPVHWQPWSEQAFEMARRLEEIGSGGLTRVGEALDIVRAAVGAIEAGDEGQLVTDGHVRPACFAGHSAETLALLETAWRIQRAVLNQVARATHERLDGSLRPEEAEG